MFRIILASFMALHGLIHLMGFLKAFNLAEIRELTLRISKTGGLLWLLCAVLFSAAAMLLAFGRGQWPVIAVPALALSQIMVVLSWKDAKFGTIANVLILVGIILIIHL